MVYTQGEVLTISGDNIESQLQGPKPHCFMPCLVEYMTLTHPRSRKLSIACCQSEPRDAASDAPRFAAIL